MAKIRQDRLRKVIATMQEKGFDQLIVSSNASIRCENCKDKLCHVKHPLRDLYRNIKLKIQ